MSEVPKSAMRSKKNGNASSTNGSSKITKESSSSDSKSQISKNVKFDDNANTQSDGKSKKESKKWQKVNLIEALGTNLPSNSYMLRFLSNFV